MSLTENKTSSDKARPFKSLRLGTERYCRRDWRVVKYLIRVERRYCREVNNFVDNSREFRRLPKS